MTARPEHTPRLTAGDLADNRDWTDLASAFTFGPTRDEWTHVERSFRAVVVSRTPEPGRTISRRVAPSTPVTLVPRVR